MYKTTVTTYYVDVILDKLVYTEYTFYKLDRQGAINAALSQAKANKPDVLHSVCRVRRVWMNSLDIK